MVELRPPVLDERGLVPSLRDCADEILARGATEYEVSGGDFEAAPEVETILYRIAREALQNVARHAEARRVDVTLDLDGDKLALVVADDGKGFDERQPAVGITAARYGLIGMRERAESVGGRVDVVSAPGEGTRVEVRLPWKPRHAEPLAA